MGEWNVYSYTGSTMQYLFFTLTNEERGLRKVINNLIKQWDKSNDSPLAVARKCIPILNMKKNRLNKKK